MVNIGIQVRLNILYALACADALGAPCEFKTPQQLKKIFPGGITQYEEGSPFGFQAGESTDDTQMAVALIAGLVKHEHGDGPISRPFRVTQAFLDWLSSHPPDVGSQTRGMLFRRERQDPQAVTVDDLIGDVRHHARGNGGLMRVAGVTVVGFVEAEAQRVAAEATAITHPAPTCILASAFMVALLESLADGRHIQSAVSYARGYAFSRLNLALVAEHLSGMKLWPLSPREGLDALAAALREVDQAIVRGSDGYVGPASGEVLSTLQAAIAHNVRYDDWHGVAQGAALGGGDADTVACVAGAMAGARGLTPADYWLDNLRIGAQWGAWSGKMTPAAGGFAKLLRDGTA